jgi:CBS-domain-containing membrane protein
MGFFSCWFAARSRRPSVSVSAEIAEPLREVAIRVGEVTTRSVISLAPGDSMLKAVCLMIRCGVYGFPVPDRGKLVGIITQGNFLSRAEIGTVQPCSPLSALGSRWLITGLWVKMPRSRPPRR